MYKMYIHVHVDHKLDYVHKCTCIHVHVDHKPDYVHCTCTDDKLVIPGQLFPAN